MNACNSVAERVALGEPIAELTEHVASCPRCQRTVQLPAQIGHAHRAVDPGLGFTARMTSGAQTRIVARRRRRVAVASSATIAAAALAVFVMTRAPEPPQQAAVQPRENEVPTVAEPEEIEQLVRLADTKRSRRMSAHWSRIQRPLAPYRALVQQAGDADAQLAPTPVIAPAVHVPGDPP